MKSNTPKKLSIVVSRWGELVAYLRKSHKSIFKFLARLYNDLDCPLNFHVLDFTTTLQCCRAVGGDFSSFFLRAATSPHE